MTDTTTLQSLDWEQEKYPVLSLKREITPNWTEWLFGMRTEISFHRYIKYKGNCWRSYPDYAILFKDGYPGVEMLDSILQEVAGAVPT